MLLRSSSAPILSSLVLYNSKESSLDLEQTLKLPRTISFLSLSQNLAKIDLQNSSSPKKTTLMGCSNVLSTKFKEKNDVKEAKMVESSMIGGGVNSNGGCKGGGRGSDGGNGRNFNGGNSYGRDRIDAYYQNMIEAHPCDALLLGNYAKFLKEVCGDYRKAEEYLERAILANPSDGHILSIYADLIWKTKKNANRAQQYFEQAIQSAPDNCYVMASYAKFLWDAENDEEDEDYQIKLDHSHLFQETKHFPPLTAAS
ncbi:hypothetical protein TSUD_260820 [Trifolium subterraneum]|uniref:Uncharacterized protein n=1 Tax=Trifolium subterraneum TaxID=3900 RepID=A0A2Z6M9X0_TRISU|nr:hypothetical protein TSUD_260820 [Trifolium subterraneum]